MQAYLADLAHLARALPTATVRRTIAIADVAAAREMAAPRPSWLAVFTKAMALAAGAHPQLKQVFSPLPWPRLYEHPFAVAAVAVNRPFDEELPTFWGRLTDPAHQGLQQLHNHLTRFKEEPVKNVGQLRRLQARGQWPWAVRRLAWAREANLSGRRRAKRLGTFAVASLGGAGADFVDPLYPATTVLSFGTIQAATVDVSLKFDARVLTPLMAAEILVDVERVLNCEIVMELRYFERLEAA